jgi:hypothetical protein
VRTKFFAALTHYSDGNVSYSQKDPSTGEIIFYYWLLNNTFSSIASQPSLSGRLEPVSGAEQTAGGAWYRTKEPITEEEEKETDMVPEEKAPVAEIAVTKSGTPTDVEEEAEVSPEEAASEVSAETQTIQAANASMGGEEETTTDGGSTTSSDTGSGDEGASASTSSDEGGADTAADSASSGQE